MLKANPPKGGDAKLPVYGLIPRIAGLPACREAQVFKITSRCRSPFFCDYPNPVLRRGSGVQTVLSGLVITAISGLTVLAFRYPRAFLRLYPYLNLGITVLFLMLTVWQVAIHTTWTAVAPFLEPGHRQTAGLAVADLQIPYLWVCASYVGVLIFLWINAKLPAFIKATENRLHD